MAVYNSQAPPRGVLPDDDWENTELAQCTMVDGFRGRVATVQRQAQQHGAFAAFPCAVVHTFSHWLAVMLPLWQPC